MSECALCSRALEGSCIALACANKAHARVVHAVLSGEPLELYVTKMGRLDPRHSLGCLPAEVLPVPPAVPTGAELARRCLGGRVMVRGAVYPLAELSGHGLALTLTLTRTRTLALT